MVQYLTIGPNQKALREAECFGMIGKANIIIPLLHSL